MKRLVLLLLPTVFFGCAGPPDESSEIGRKADALLSELDQRGEFSGAILLTKRGSVVLKKAYGYADGASGKRNELTTRFAIGSVTKQFTAAAILQLAEQGRLGIDDRLSKYVSGYALDPAITLRHLLTHTSGLPDYVALPDVDALLGSPQPFAGVLAAVAKKAPEFSPGARFGYSNTNYMLLGHIIEQVSSESYASYQEKNVMGPAGMTSTGVFNPKAPPPDMAIGHRVVEGANAALSAAELEDLSGIPGDGSLYSTVSDLERWAAALGRPMLLSSASLELMTTPYLGDYGFGVSIETIAARKALTHSGLVRGYSSFLTRFVGEGAVMILLSNRENTPLRKIRDLLAGLLFCAC